MATLGALPPTNNAINGDHHDYAADSPHTPVNNILLDDVKIDIDHTDDAPILDLQAEIKDPDSIPVHIPDATPPRTEGEPLPEVEMAEQDITVDTQDTAEQDVNVDTQDSETVVPMPEYPPVSPSMPSSVPASEQNFDATGPVEEPTSPMDTDVHVNGDAPNGDAPSTNGLDHTASSGSLRRSADEMDGEEHPAKRARINAEGDSAATVANGHTTETQGPSTLSAAQHKFCFSTVRTLKKMKDSMPFLRPVDPVALNIPHYPSIVRHPMDFATIERKLTSSNPAKYDPNPANPRYQTADEFIADVRLIFSNSMLFNGPDHAVSQMGKRVEAVFDKQIKQLPPPDEPKAAVKKVETPPPPPAAAPKKATARRASTSVPVIRRNEAEAVSSRPKREIHPPPPKDLPYAEPNKKPQRKVRKPQDAATAMQLQFCGKVLSELHKKQHWQMAHPFYDPVDWMALNIPDYPKVIKKPMDLSTMRKKLDHHEYQNASQFQADFRLMIRNCFTYNPSGTPVNLAGIELTRLFDEKWKGLPIIDPNDDESEEEDYAADSEDERTRAIIEMEQKIAAMRDQVSALKTTKPKKEKKKEKRDKYVPPVASSSKASKAKPAPPPPKKKTAGGKKANTDDDVLSFEQKKELSEAISALEGTKLERVIQIIHEGVPEIRDSTEEIELEIDTLPSGVLTKLYNFVIRPLKAGPKRSRVPKGGGTGGLKRKSMDEDVEAEKIRQLEERMRLFEEGPNASAAPPVVAHESDGSSDSSSDDSSDSE